MKLDNLKYVAGSRKKAKRVGRGFGSGIGKTATRGSKGQNSRKSGPVRLGFEGGQTTLYRRIPKVGFNNVNFANQYNVVSLNQIITAKLTNVDQKSLVEKGLIKENKLPIKIIGKAELKSALNVSVHKITKGAEESLQKSKSKITIIK